MGQEGGKRKRRTEGEGWRCRKSEGMNKKFKKRSNWEKSGVWKAASEERKQGRMKGEGGGGIKKEETERRAIKLWQRQPWWLSWRRPQRAGRARSPGKWAVHASPPPRPHGRHPSVSIPSLSSTIIRPSFSPLRLSSLVPPSPFSLSLHHSLASHSFFPPLIPFASIIFLPNSTSFPLSLYHSQLHFLPPFFCCSASSHNLFPHLLHFFPFPPLHSFTIPH